MNDILFDDDIQIYVDRVLQHLPADSAELDAAEQRRRYRKLCQAFDAEWPDGVETEDDVVAGADGDIPVRRYRPIGGSPESAPLGCLVYLHGGGWVVGDIESHDGVCAEIAQRTGAAVIAVDYRLAPECPYPGAHEDCWAVLIDTAAHAEPYGIDPARIAIGGDSAGGNIAAGLAFRARDMDGPALCAQFLIYPALGGAYDLPSYIELADAPLMTTGDMKAYSLAYFGMESPPDSSLASPLKAGSFAGLAPAFIQPAAVDPLRDDAVMFAKALGEAGVEAELVIEHGLPHGWLRARHCTVRGAAAFDRLIDAVRWMVVKE